MCEKNMGVEVLYQGPPESDEAVDVVDASNVNQFIKK
jgi:hypothetical protein